MKIIKPDVELWHQSPTLDGMYDHIERCGRLCMLSSPKDGKSKDFVDRMITLGHGSVLEHGTVYLIFPIGQGYIPFFKHNPYSRTINKMGFCYVTTNLRVLIENGLLTGCRRFIIDAPTEFHIKRYTAHFTTQIIVDREANRHRVNSITGESTRYCAYDKDKFGNEIKISCPTNIEYDRVSEGKYDEDSLRNMCSFVGKGKDVQFFTDISYWLFANLACEYSYMNLRRLGWTAERARVVLPVDTNSELVHTAFISDWEHFFKLRCDMHAHEDIRIIANKLKELINDER